MVRYMCKEAPYGGELSFSEDSMRDMHNADLCGTLGNLIHRATSLCVKYCGGVVPDVPAPDTVTPIPNLGEVIDSYNAKMNRYELEGGANVAIQSFRDINGYLQDQAPWHIVDNLVAQQVIVRATLEAVYALAHLLLPFLPNGGAKIFCKLGTDPVALCDLNLDCRNLQTGSTIYVGDILYERSVVDDKDKPDAKVETYAEAQQRKKEAKAAQIAASKAKQAAAGDVEDDVNQPSFTKMDIRVGKIVKVWNHETADKLFCEQIDVGEAEGPREIASGLREHYTLEEMQDRLVLVVCNLKAAKIVGFSSNGMVLAAKATDGSKVELVEAPTGSTIGESVFIPGLTGEPLSSAQIKKKKMWETVAAGLRTGAEGVATWEGQEIRTSAGVCKAASLEEAPIA
jgi:methionine--tRNA ligase beta chain